jgi:hypothetical protein
MGVGQVRERVQAARHIVVNYVVICLVAGVRHRNVGVCQARLAAAIGGSWVHNEDGNSAVGSTQENIFHGYTKPPERERG